MCRWCDGSVGSLDGFGVERRDPMRLGGRFWSGSHADVVAGGLTGALGALREQVVEEQAFRAGPIVVVTLAGSGDDVRCFLGAELGPEGAAPSARRKHGETASTSGQDGLQESHFQPPHPHAEKLFRRPSPSASSSRTRAGASEDVIRDLVPVGGLVQSRSIAETNRSRIAFGARDDGRGG